MVKCERPYTFPICNILQIPELVCRNWIFLILNRLLNNIEISDPIMETDIPDVASICSYRCAFNVE